MVDTVILDSDALPEEIPFRCDGAVPDLLITLRTGETLRVKDQFSAFDSGPFGVVRFDRVQHFEFASTGAVVDYEDVMQRILIGAKALGDDQTYEFFREDVLDGGIGNDYLAGEGEEDTHVWGVAGATSPRCSAPPAARELQVISKRHPGCGRQRRYGPQAQQSSGSLIKPAPARGRHVR